MDPSATNVNFKRRKFQATVLVALDVPIHMSIVASRLWPHVLHRGGPWPRRGSHSPDRAAFAIEKALLLSREEAAAACDASGSITPTRKQELLWIPAQPT